MASQQQCLMILRTSRWMWNAIPFHIRISWRGIDFVTTWHFVPIFGLWLRDKEVIFRWRMDEYVLWKIG